MEGIRNSIKSDFMEAVIETDESEIVAQKSTCDVSEKIADDSQMKIQQRDLFLKHGQNTDIISNRLQVFPNTDVLDQEVSVTKDGLNGSCLNDRIDDPDTNEMPTTEIESEQDFTNIEHCNDNTTNNADVKLKSSKLNPLARLFKYFKRGFKLNDNNSINKNIESDTNEMPTTETESDQDFSNIEHCNDNTNNSTDFKVTFKLNPLANDFIYQSRAFELNGSCLNDGIDNPDTNEMPKTETESEQDFCNIEHCNDNTTNNADVKLKSSKLNPLARLFKYFKLGSKLDTQC